MRKFALEGFALFGYAVVATTVMAGCSDAHDAIATGPDASSFEPATQSPDSGSGMTSAGNACNAGDDREAMSAAIVPPFSMGGVDLSTGGTFNPFVSETGNGGGAPRLGGKAPAFRLCEGAAYSPCGACCDGTGNPGYSWGERHELQTCYDFDTHQMTFLGVTAGYEGALTFTLPAMVDGRSVPYAKDQSGGTGHDLTYVWRIGAAITEDNGSGPVPLDLDASPEGVSREIANKMYLGLMQTFMPAAIAATTGSLSEMTDPKYDCLTSTKCRTSGGGTMARFGVLPLGVDVDLALSSRVSPKTAGLPTAISLHPTRL